MAGVDLHTVGELLGHRTAQMTKRYAHFNVHHKQATVERIFRGTKCYQTAISRKGPQRATSKLL
jgi:hypothetical protein